MVEAEAKVHADATHAPFSIMSLKENPLPVGYVEAPVESFLGVNAEGLVQLPELLRQQIAAASLPSHARVNQMGARLFVPSHQGLQDLNAMQAEAEVEDLDSNNQVTASPIRVRTVGELGQVAGLGNISLENSLKYATGCMMTNCVESDMGWKGKLAVLSVAKCQARMRSS
jgi:hypothetical protein